MFRTARQRPYLGHHRSQRLLGWVGVDRLLAGPSPPVAALDAPAEEVEPLIDMADPRLLDRQAHANR